ncbi:hypothetical protein WMF18_31735 [Sorangium sp. So ce315]|uniref:hypothetical protein n=1 Tax=Sorangium sp. So ce315 TaxID=3133299 RepID=UPI003F61CF63
MTHSAETVQRVGCHVATYLTTRRATVAGVDPATIAGRYTSTYDLSIAAGIATEQPASLRAFGWHITIPAISQRVANDTAQTLTEIEARFPPATP